MLKIHPTTVLTNAKTGNAHGNSDHRGTRLGKVELEQGHNAERKKNDRHSHVDKSSRPGRHAHESRVLKFGRSRDTR